VGGYFEILPDYPSRLEQGVNPPVSSTRIAPRKNAIIERGYLVVQGASS
jgi:hypothetical protein